ncbi:C40 family peptidase [Flavobacterium hauense]
MKMYKTPLLLAMALTFAFCKKEVTVSQPVKTTVVTETKTTAETAKREEIVAFAKKYMGTKYCYAGGSPENGFDCSGFVNFVFKHFDMELPRSSSGFTNLGKPLKPEEFRVGDVLVFYGYRDTKSVGHVGIICEANGMKSKFIHSSSGKEMAVTISELGSDMYTKRFYKCIDPFKL